MKKIILVICSIMICVILMGCSSTKETEEIEVYHNYNEISVYETNNVFKYIHFLEEIPEDAIIDISIAGEGENITYYVTFKK